MIGRMAWKRRSRPCLADPPADSPSTMYSSLCAGSRSWQSASLPGRLLPSSAPFPPYEIARLARRLARPRSVDRFADDALGDRGILLEKLTESVVDDRLDDTLDLGVPELRLGLSFELRPRNLDADDAGQSFANVVAADAGVLQVLRQVVLDGVRIDRAGQRGTEAGQVRAAFVGVDVVREGEDQLGVAVVPLKRDFGVDAVLLALHEDRLLVDRPSCSCSGARRRT